VARPAPTRSRWLTDQAARTQIGERLATIDRHQAGDLPTAHRHDDLGSVLDLLDVAAQVIVQLADADLRLGTISM
jgi:hypothetical protein